MNEEKAFSLAKKACEDAFRRIGQNAGETAGKIQEAISIDKLMEAKRRGMSEILAMFPLEVKTCPFCIKCRMDSTDIDSEKTYKVGDRFRVKGSLSPDDVIAIYYIGEGNIQLFVPETHGLFNKNKVRVNNTNKITEEELKSMFTFSDTFDEAELIDEEKKEE